VRLLGNASEPAEFAIRGELGAKSWEYTGDLVGEEVVTLVVVAAVVGTTPPPENAAADAPFAVAVAAAIEVEVAVAFDTLIRDSDETVRGPVATAVVRALLLFAS